MAKRCLLTWVLVCCISNAAALSSELAKQQLIAMRSAVHSLPYSGTLVYQRADVLANLSFQHDLKNGKEFARLRRLSGQPLERAKQGNQLIKAEPGPDVLRTGYSLPGLLSADPKRIFDAPYQITLGEQERVADRTSQIIFVEALDGHRHNYQFWVDVETSLLLKAQTLDVNLEVVEQFEFSELLVGPQTLKIAADEIPMQVNVYPIHRPNTVLQFSPANWLPKGYQLISALPSKSAGRSIYTLVYSDGLGSFSIFLELMDGVNGPPMHAILGPTVALGKDYSVAKGFLRVTLVGEIPLKTGKTIIDALDVDGLKRLLGHS